MAECEEPVLDFDIALWLAVVSVLTTKPVLFRVLS
jgi:hypothetical protein